MYTRCPYNKELLFEEYIINGLTLNQLIEKYKWTKKTTRLRLKFFGLYKRSNAVLSNIQTKKNGMWKGNNVGYRALHEWIKRHKPKKELCENCGKTLSYDLANISGKYTRDINDYKWLCRSCHMKEDGRVKNLKQYMEVKNEMPTL